MDVGIVVVGRVWFALSFDLVFLYDGLRCFHWCGKQCSWYGDCFCCLPISKLYRRRRRKNRTVSVRTEFVLPWSDLFKWQQPDKESNIIGWLWWRRIQRKIHLNLFPLLVHSPARSIWSHCEWDSAADLSRICAATPSSSTSSSPSSSYCYIFLFAHTRTPFLSIS